MLLDLIPELKTELRSEFFKVMSFCVCENKARLNSNRINAALIIPGK
jgi:hypothetical protein